MAESGINIGRSTSGNKFESKLEGRKGWFRIIHVKGEKKVKNIHRLGNTNSSLDLQYLEAKEIMQKT
jgi:hypothetical protein